MVCVRCEENTGLFIREMISKPGCKYVVHIGRRVFIHKELFDAELKKSAKFQLTM